MLLAVSDMMQHLFMLSIHKYVSTLTHTVRNGGFVAQTVQPTKNLSADMPISNQNYPFDSYYAPAPNMWGH